MYEGAPNFPDKGSLLEDHREVRVNILYTAPTAIRAFIKWGDEWAEEIRPFEPAPARHGRRADQSRSLDVVSHLIGGERCPIVDTWWQTETGGT
jgi:acetyl-CoA synthetase